MCGAIHRLMSGLIRPRLAPRGVALLVCAIVVCGLGARSVVALSSTLHAAFEGVGTTDSATSEPWPGAVRLAAGQQQPAAKPAKPATPPPARKPPARKASPGVTAETQSPAIMEELPPGQIKAVLPLAGAAPGD